MAEIRQPEVKVYAMNDCDWVAAPDLETAKAFYLQLTGFKGTEEECFDDPYELSAEAMGSLIFVDTEVSCRYCREGAPKAKPIGIQPRHKVGGLAIPCEIPRRTFAEQLARMISQGEQFPCFFASTEY